jgi:hypothetical protein
MDQYVKDAKMIYADYKVRIVSDDMFKKLNIEEKLDYYQRQYHDFTMTFPIVLRYMIQLDQYSTKAFVRFVKRLQKKPYKSELEYCERQADYVKFLHLELSNKHDDKEMAQKVWKQTYDMLVAEIKMFKEANEKVKLKTEKNNNQNNIEKREELKKYLTLQ